MSACVRRRWEGGGILLPISHAGLEEEGGGRRREGGRERERDLIIVTEELEKV